MPIATLLLPFFCLGAQAAEQPITLRYQPSVGNRYVYAISNEMEMKSPEMPEMGDEMKTGLTSTLVVRIVGRTGDLTKVISSTVGAKFMSPGMESLPPEQLASISRQLNTSVTTKAGILGNVIPIGKSTSSAMTNGILSSLGGFNLFPQDAVSVGDTWTSEADMGAAMKQSKPTPLDISGGKFPVTMKLVGVETKGGIKLAKVQMDATGTMTMYPPEDAGDNTEAELTITMHSDMVIDVATGVQLENITKGSVMVAVGAVPAMEQLISMTMKIKS